MDDGCPEGRPQARHWILPNSPLISPAGPVIHPKDQHSLFWDAMTNYLSMTIYKVNEAARPFLRMRCIRSCEL